MDTSLHYTSVNHATCLVSTINKLRRGGQLCDVIIVAGNARIAAHRLVLAASSPYFGPLLEPTHSPPVNGMPLEICLNDLDPDPMEQIIEFCYTSSICVNEENVWTLLPTATRLQMSELCDLCTDYLRSSLSPDTSMQTCLAALRSGLVDLAADAQKMLKDDLDKVLESEGFLEMNVNDVSEVLQALPSSVLGHRDTVRAIRNWFQYKQDSRQFNAAQLARSFPGLLSRLKEFLPEDVVLRPVDFDSLPASPSELTPQASPVDFSRSREVPECDSDMNGLDLSLSREDAFESVASDSQDSFSAPLCLVCGEIFHTPTDLSQHKSDCTQILLKESGEVLENGFPSSPAGSSDSREEERDGVQGKASDQHVCQLCYKIFGDKKSLGKHMRTHSQSGFSCNVCEKRYSTKSHLLGHMRLHSGTQSPFTCDYCRHPFSSYCALKVHMRGHKGARPFSCPTCGQHFAKNIHLKRHISTHTGIKPHECELCLKHFSRSDHLKRHIQSIHAGQRPHVCHVCNKAFVRKYELNKHLELHHAATAVGSRPAVMPMRMGGSWDGAAFLGLGAQRMGSPATVMSAEAR
ncbi:myoneurin-like [Littorina saxatilis]|uniref:Zinc finger protein 865 n=1 Tax=Littorina saxatilis TaxID=31220 RepID=A0AAN9AM85_9CAEN